MSAVALRAGDEQWDGRFGGLENYDYRQLVLYRGEVYCTGYKWDGTNFTEWTQPRFGFAKVATEADLFVGGNAFAMYGSPGNGVARWDGTNWNALSSGIAVDDYHPYYVASLVTNGTDLYAGGSFIWAGGQPASSIARWDGTNWHDLGAGLFVPGDFGDGYPPNIYSLVMHNNSLYASGQIAFDDYNGENRGVVRWDGTNWSALGNGISPGAFAMASNGNDLFGVAGGLQRWDGTNWTTIGGVNGRIYALAVGLDAIYIGGNFTMAGGVRAENIAKWDGTKWSALGSGLTGRFPHDQYAGENVYSILVWGTDVIVSGPFTSAGGKPSINFAIWHELPSLKASYANGNLQLSWPASFTNYVLEANETLSGTNWTEVSPPATNNRYATPASGGSKFFRLRRL